MFMVGSGTMLRTSRQIARRMTNWEPLSDNTLRRGDKKDFQGIERSPRRSAGFQAVQACATSNSARPNLQNQIDS